MWCGSHVGQNEKLWTSVSPKYMSRTPHGEQVLWRMISLVGLHYDAIIQYVGHFISGAIIQQYMIKTDPYELSNTARSESEMNLQPLYIQI